MAYVYGLHAVDALLRQNPQQVEQLWLQSGRNDKRMSALETLARNQGVATDRESREQLDGRVQGRHQGVVAIVQEASSQQWDEKALWTLLDELQGPATLLVLDGITDPHNLGACLRSADAAGVHAVIVPRDKSADLTPVSRKVACGAAEVVPFVRVTNLARTLEGLKERGIWLYGAAGEAETTLYDSDLSGPLALVMGAEGAGLRRLTRECCDYLVKLPMAGSVSSLNVSVATGVCLFEVVRQRKAG
ncbi:23S rRNA (guanosine(2251)-2'-O)-methyltransferase RlmB [Halieaceae bacterium IMCC14734]|uniref:23S rRNA (guanosine-2'-O-)-methyltransferase RlmB n=1 Tax=Candidatus Litorirhabdus singularis TaxID=2518993 RepID=A0ABT3TKH7_9GAMM|nr:23S rRNA (guanosine(2251)-2'-O)-methyltransferase RlmB [Candidatus Litorirhabdus singularis]MCX2982761.1 23S rRNA (guanosine(2251)-2'-O)-methyltransferase RlmB [Candidatus Litorirhabdus singularis]